MDWIVLVGCIIGAWAMLRIIGGERDRRVAELADQAKLAAADAAPPHQIPTLK